MQGRTTTTEGRLVTSRHDELREQIAGETMQAIPAMVELVSRASAFHWRAGVIAARACSRVRGCHGVALAGFRDWAVARRQDVWVALPRLQQTNR